MHVPPAPQAAPRIFVETIGHLVPRGDFTGRVHSVFAHACNVACDGTLITLAARGAGNSPTTLLLGPGAPADLRHSFDVGEPIERRGGRMRTRRRELDLTGATLWHPAPPRPRLPDAQIDANLRQAGERLAYERRTRSSVIDRDAAGIVAALDVASRDLDGDRALRCVDRLLGWGEGLTPAGDDFLVGWLAGQDALVPHDAARRRFRDDVATVLAAATTRTTPIAAHFLRLAARGHYAEPLSCLRDALLAERRPQSLTAALDAAVAVGATSGVDMVSGLLAGVRAWLPRVSCAQ
jgi:hypothetical protein